MPDPGPHHPGTQGTARTTRTAAALVEVNSTSVGSRILHVLNGSDELNVLSRPGDFRHLRRRKGVLRSIPIRNTGMDLAPRLLERHTRTMRTPETRVTVNLVDGKLDGLEADAPRDEAGRVLNEMWVGTAQVEGHVIARAQPRNDSTEGPPALYRLESWSGENPVYRWVEQATWFQADQGGAASSA